MIHHRNLSSNDEEKSGSSLYLHVGPAGECWTGASIFAAKHLQPDYVKSVPLTTTVDVELLLEEIESNPTLGQHIYDNETIPQSLLEKVKFRGTKEP